METRWILNEDVDKQHVSTIMEALKIDENLATLLVQRGITNYDEAKIFFRPSLSYLHDPYLMKDMDKAVDRVQQAMDKGEKVLIYGDYDVDGTTAVAVVYSYLKNFINKKKIAFYIPDRYDEGYGISYKGIDYAAQNGYTLVIALDCGIKAVERIQYANEKGVDFIICDHHRAGDELPAAVAVLDPKRPDCEYPDKELSGCGVGFKLISALSIRLKRPIEEVYELLDLLAISIAADIVPITGENRVLAFYGLRQLNRKPRPGIEAILQHANVYRREEYSDQEEGETLNVLTRELTISDLVFMIGPRINAAGRIDKASDSVRLLIATNKAHAEKLAASINNLNDTRREFDNRITDEALNMISEDEKLRNAHSTVIFNENWHKGVIGIVASRLTDYYYRPTIVLTRANDLITGSARSIKNFDIYDAIDHCSDLLEHFGGHKYAAGLSLKPENLNLFRERFEEYVVTHLVDEELVPELGIDLNINFKQITPKFLRILKQFAPFGPGNMSPVFRTDNVIDTGSSRPVGAHKHLKLTVTQVAILKMALLRSLALPFKKVISSTESIVETPSASAIIWKTITGKEKLHSKSTLKT
jgi:single-stranded-DNA-specific exonuclease RecJ